MKVAELRKLLEGTGASIKKVGFNFQQNPFVMYENKYYLEAAHFKTKDQVKEFFAGKKFVARDCKDLESRGLIKVEYWFHQDLKHG